MKKIGNERAWKSIIDSLFLNLGGAHDFDFDFDSNSYLYFVKECQ